jgi:hypothetical protein
MEERMKRLDLRKDFSEIYAFLADRVRNFDPVANDGPGEGGLVTRIDFGFGLYQSGWVCLVFDTRPDPEPDGEWTMHIDGNDLERPRWTKVCDALDEGPVALVLPDGSRRVLPAAGGGLATALGDMLRGVLLTARADKVFATLPKAPRCELGVEEQEGDYGWPAYEERGKDNLAEPS